LILIDANILLYAEDASSNFNYSARRWLDKQLSGSDSVCFCWSVISAYLRISTNLRIYDNPLRIDEAIERVSSWLEQPCARIIAPTEAHWEIFSKLLLTGQAYANLVPDAHLAALAIEYGCTLYSSDRDFARFKGLKWRNPL
jgi:hypothetical protein